MGPNSRKRPSERPTSDSEMFAIYEDLASESEPIRLKAASRLMTRFQSGDAEALEPVLTRLVRGLCSTRKAARSGFSVALTEVLRQHAGSNGSITTEHFLDLLEKITTPTSDAIAQETRDRHLGKIFGAGALVVAGVLFEDDAGSDEQWTRLLQILFALAKKKPWLREECAWVCFTALNKMGAKSAAARRASILMQTLREFQLVKSPEGVALWLQAVRACPGVTLPEHVFENNDPLAKPNRKVLARIMRGDGSQQEIEGDQAKAERDSWFAFPRFALRTVFSFISESQTQEGFAQFWRELVDENLFVAGASPERKGSGFALFSSLAQTEDAKFVPALLSTNILNAMNQQLSKKGYLTQAAEQAIKTLVDRVEREPELMVALLRRLLTDGSIIKLALRNNIKSRLIEKIIAFATADNASEVVETAVSALETYPDPQGTRDETLDSLIVLIVTRVQRLPYPSATDANIAATRQQYTRLLNELAKRAYFGKNSSASATEKKDQEGKPENDREFYNSQLNKALATLLKKDSDATYYYVQAVKALTDLQKSQGTVLDKEVQAQVDKARKRLSKLTKGEKEISSQSKALILLFASCILQVYGGDADALEALGDLEECYNSISGSDDAEEHAKAAGAIIELLLGFTSKPATLYRDLAKEVFGLCTDMVTSDALQSMIDVLETKEDISGQEQMFDEKNDEASEDNSDVEMMDGDEEGHDGSEKETDSDNDEDDEDDEDEADEDGDEDEDSSEAQDSEDDELAQFDAALASALRTRRADDDLAHAEAESSESDMDDEQMEALDGHISLMFKQRKTTDAKTKRKQAKEARENMVVFKTRVLDLITIYLRAQLPNPLAMHLVVPLAKLVGATGNEKVRRSAIEALEWYFKRAKATRKEGKPDKKARKTAVAMLADVHELVVASPRSNVYLKACDRASLLLTKIFLANGGELEKVQARYDETVARLAEKPDGVRKRVGEHFVKGWDGWSADYKKNMGA